MTNIIKDDLSVPSQRSCCHIAAHHESSECAVRDAFSNSEGTGKVCKIRSKIASPHLLVGYKKENDRDRVRECSEVLTGEDQS